MFAAARQGLGRVAQAARPRPVPARRHMSADVRHSEPINLLGRGSAARPRPARSGLPLPNGSGGQKFTQKTGFARPHERPETEYSSRPKTAHTPHTTVAWRHRAAARAEEAEDAVEAEDEAHYLFGAELLATNHIPASKDGRRAAVVWRPLCSVSGRRSRGRAKPGFCFNVLPTAAAG